MDRMALGERLCNWHSSMHDPVYAVGSFYVSGQVYPDKEIVQDAISNLTRDLNQFQAMARGEVVMVGRQGKQVDLRVFAGYTEEDLEENAADLEEIVAELTLKLTEDYT